MKRKRELAAAIVRDLFTNGTGEMAQRLVLMVDTPTKRDLGGWSQSALYDRILELLANHD